MRKPGMQSDMNNPGMQSGSTKLTSDALEEHNQEAEDENDKLNVCVRGAVKQMDSQIMAMEETKYTLEQLQVEGRGDKLKNLSLEEITEKLGELSKTKLDMRSVLFGKQGAEHKEQKVNKLTAASALLTDCKEVVQDAKRILKSHGAASTAGSVAG